MSNVYGLSNVKWTEKITIENSPMAAYLGEEIAKQGKEVLEETIKEKRKSISPITDRKIEYKPKKERNGPCRRLWPEEVSVMNSIKRMEGMINENNKTAIRRRIALLTYIVEIVKAHGFFSVHQHVRNNPKPLEDRTEVFTNPGNKQRYHEAVIYTDLRWMEKMGFIEVSGVGNSRVYKIKPKDVPDVDLSQPGKKEEVKQKGEEKKITGHDLLDRARIRADEAEEFKATEAIKEVIQQIRQQEEIVKRETAAAADMLNDLDKLLKLTPREIVSIYHNHFQRGPSNWWRRDK